MLSVVRPNVVAPRKEIKWRAGPIIILGRCWTNLIQKNEKLK
jgi:hypothetical protein